MKTSKYSNVSETHCASKVSYLQTRQNEQPGHANSRYG